jgi:hypothetical protein
MSFTDFLSGTDGSGDSMPFTPDSIAPPLDQPNSDGGQPAGSPMDPAPPTPDTTGDVPAGDVPWIMAPPEPDLPPADQPPPDTHCG